jgi:hypothetical protein
VLALATCFFDLVNGRRWQVAGPLAGELVRLERLEQRVLVFYCNTLIRELNLSVEQKGIDIGMRSLAFPVTPPCVRVRTRRFVRIKRRECNATEEVPSLRNKWLAWHRREPVFG